MELCYHGEVVRLLLLICPGHRFFIVLLTFFSRYFTVDRYIIVVVSFGINSEHEMPRLSKTIQYLLEKHINRHAKNMFMFKFMVIILEFVCVSFTKCEQLTRSIVIYVHNFCIRAHK